jgi:hypothetical protein
MAFAINMSEAIKPSDCDHPLLKIYLGDDALVKAKKRGFKHFALPQGELVFCVECGERYFIVEMRKTRKEYSQ